MPNSHLEKKNSTLHVRELIKQTEFFPHVTRVASEHDFIQKDTASRWKKVQQFLEIWRTLPGFPLAQMSLNLLGCILLVSAASELKSKSFQSAPGSFKAAILEFIHRLQSPTLFTNKLRAPKADIGDVLNQHNPAHDEDFELAFESQDEHVKNQPASHIPNISRSKPNSSSYVSNLWRFSIKTVTPEDMKTKVLQILSADFGVSGKMLQTYDVPGGSEIRFILKESSISPIHDALAKLAPSGAPIIFANKPQTAYAKQPAPQRTTEIDTDQDKDANNHQSRPIEEFSWYRVHSKKTLTAGYSAVVIWITQPPVL
jgi:hypothetical protein